MDDVDSVSSDSFGSSSHGRDNSTGGGRVRIGSPLTHPKSSGSGATVYCICRSSKATGFMIACDKCEEWYHGSCINIKEKDAKYIKTFYCPPCRDNDASLKLTYKQHHVSQGAVSKSKDDSASAGVGRSGRWCGECAACLRTTDCGVCDFCRDMRKFGGPNKLRQKCRRKQCLRRGAFPKVSQVLCAHAEPSPSPPSIIAVGGSEEEEEEYEPPLVTNRPTFTSALTSRSKSGAGAASSSYYAGKKKPLCKKKGKSHSSSNQQQSRRKSTGAGSRKYTNDYSSSGSRSRHRRMPRGDDDYDDDDIDDDIDDLIDDSDGRQCLQPTCINAARKGSRYCSDECGIKMATLVICKMLPHRIGMYRGSTRVMSDESNKSAIDLLTKQQEDNKLQLQKLYHYENLAFIDLLGKAKATKPMIASDNKPGDESTAAAVATSEETRQLQQRATISCHVCDNDVSAKTYLRHMEKCIKKYEGSVSYYSSYRTETGDPNVFCDHSPQPHMYCKKLKYFCHEHYKEPKVSDSEVCGCPLKTGYSLFDDFTKESCSDKFCNKPSKKCLLHHGWEKELNGEIQTDKLALWMSSERLMSDIQRHHNQIDQRGGLVGLLCNNTISS